MKKLTKILAVLLSVAVAVCSLPFGAFAADYSQTVSNEGRYGMKDSLGYALTEMVDGHILEETVVTTTETVKDLPGVSMFERKTGSLVDGKNYVIVTTTDVRSLSADGNGSASPVGYAVGVTGTSTKVTTASVTDEWTDNVIVTDDFTYVWKWNAATRTFTNVADSSLYLGMDGSVMSTAAQTAWTVTETANAVNGLNAYTFYGNNGSGDYYMRYQYHSSSGGEVVRVSGTAANFFVFEEVQYPSGSEKAYFRTDDAFVNGEEYMLVTTTASSAGGSTVTGYQRMTGDALVNGTSYIIATTNTSARALVLNGTGIARSGDYINSGSASTLSLDVIDDTMLWTYNNGSFRNVSNPARYLTNSGNNALTTGTSATTWTVSPNGENYRIYRTVSNRTRYIQYASSTFSLTTTSTNLHIYEPIVETTVGGEVESSTGYALNISGSTVGVTSSAVTQGWGNDVIVSSDSASAWVYNNGVFTNVSDPSKTLTVGGVSTWNGTATKNAVNGSVTGYTLASGSSYLDYEDGSVTTSSEPYYFMAYQEKSYPVAGGTETIVAETENFEIESGENYAILGFANTAPNAQTAHGALTNNMEEAINGVQYYFGYTGSGSNVSTDAFAWDIRITEGARNGITAYSFYDNDEEYNVRYQYNNGSVVVRISGTQCYFFVFEETVENGTTVFKRIDTELTPGKKYIIVTTNNATSSDSTGVTGSGNAICINNGAVSYTSSNVTTNYADTITTWDDSYVFLYTPEGYFASMDGVTYDTALAADTTPTFDSGISRLVDGDQPVDDFTFTKVDDGWYVSYTENGTTYYLNISSTQASFSTTPQVLAIDTAATASTDVPCIRISDASKTNYLAYNGTTYGVSTSATSAETALYPYAEAQFPVGEEYYVEIVYNGAIISQTLRWIANVTAADTRQFEYATNIDITDANTSVIWSIDEQYDVDGNLITEAEKSIASINDSGFASFTGNEGTIIVKVSIESAIDSTGEISYVATDYIKIIVSAGDIPPLTDTSDHTNFPEYPNEGSVSIDKFISESNNFFSDGLLQLDLEVTGVPKNTGVDVVVVVDFSSSMLKNYVSGDGSTDLSTNNRLISAVNSTNLFIDQVLAANEDGSASNNRVAVVRFSPNGVADPELSTNGSYGSTSDYEDGYVTPMTSAAVNWNNMEHVISGFVGADEKASLKSKVSALLTEGQASGTNYDAGLWYAKQLLEEAYTPERQQFVVFLSDGKPTQYNNRSWESSNGSASQGTSEINLLFYREIGAYKFATKGLTALNDPSEVVGYVEATGDSSEKYYADYGAGPRPHDLSEAIKTMGATLYTIAFDVLETSSGLDDNYYFTAAQAMEILKKMASVDEDGNPLSYNVASTNELVGLLGDIAGAIKQAGTRAYVEDIIGSNFELQYKPVQLRNTNEYFTPEITITNYPLNADGTRDEANATVIESVRFEYDSGSDTYSAYSSILGDDVNILSYTDGVEVDGVITASKFTYNFATQKFNWNIGDITSDLIVLSYDIYLTGSMEGEVESGTYDTNQSAILYYYNYLDNLCSLTFPVPQAVWGQAKISYQFYLVNEQGKPVNTKGQVVPFANRVIVVPEQVYATVLLNEQTVTLDAIFLAAGDVLPDGYTIYTKNNIDPGYALYTDSADMGGDVLWSKSETIGDAVVEYRGGSKGIAQMGTFNDLAVAFPVLFSISAYPDIVVADYGLPININVIANDLGVDNAIYGLGTQEAVLPSGSTTFTSSPYTSDEITLTTLRNGNTVTSGKAELYTPSNSNTKMVRYTMATDLDHVETFWYGAGNAVESKYVTSYVKVIPATTVYYEDNFAYGDSSWIEYVGDWTATGTQSPTQNGTQDTDRPGTDNRYDDAKNNYNYDSSYTDYNTYSYGSAHFATETEENGSNHYVQFCFSGTGFDVISRTNNDTGYVIVWVYDTNGTDSTADDKLASKQVIDTYYSSGDLYQIPVINCYDLPYARYRVKIGVVHSEILADTDEGNYTFYIDAVKVYNPVDPFGDDKEVATDAYIADNEAFTTTLEMRDILISQDNTVQSGTDGGVVYIDGSTTQEIGEHTNQLDRLIGSDDDSKLALLNALTFANAGPNNEVYVGPGQTIAFKIAGNNLNKITSVQLGAKAPEGAAANMVVSYIAVSGETRNTYTQTLAVNREIATATDMYYNITPAVSIDRDSDSSATKTKTIVITNTGDGILALSNLKIATASALGTSTSNSETDEEFVIEAVLNAASMGLNNYGEALVASYLLTVSDENATAGSVFTYTVGNEPNAEKPEKPENPDKPDNTDKPGATDKPVDSDDSETPEPPQEPEKAPENAHDGILNKIIDAIIGVFSYIWNFIKPLVTGAFQKFSL